MLDSRYQQYWDYIKDSIPLKSVCAKLNLPVKRSGSEFRTQCLFHQPDNHPSLVLYDDGEHTKHYHCYSCAAHGDIFSFVQKACGFSDFKESLLWIETEFPEVKSQKPAPITQAKEAKKILNAYELAVRLLQRNSNSLNNRELYLQYAYKRGFTLSEWGNFGLFYTDGNILSRQADREQQQLLVSKNLLVSCNSDPNKEDTKYRDYYSTPRLIFTLRDENKQIIGLAGRAFQDFDRPKYLFTKGLSKANLLYRLDHVYDEIRRKSSGDSIVLYVVEGLFDALRLESLGVLAVAVLGSHITAGQLRLLERFASFCCNSDIILSIRLFLDSDDAGVYGMYQSAQSLVKSEQLRFSLPEIIIIRSSEENRAKDPDDLLKGKTAAALSECTFQLSLPEFLLRYAEKGTALIESLEITFSELYDKLPTLKKIYCLNHTANLFSSQIWDDLETAYTGLQVSSSNILHFLRILSSKEKNPESISVEIGDYSSDRSYTQALYAAKYSSKNRPVPLDPAAWIRIQKGSDLLYPALSRIIEKQEHIHFPYLTYAVPKNRIEDRLIALPCHEELIIQHYLLQEILREDFSVTYANYIPAVRYDETRMEDEVYTTGFPKYPEPQPTVSFAYQINMAYLASPGILNSGLFRPYYDCWKSYIDYLRESIIQIEGNAIYRLKVDVKGFYSNITRVSARDMLFPALRNALGTSQDKKRFSRFRFDEEMNNSEKASIITEYILDELFGRFYYSAADGTKTAGPKLIGIPQGPDLSAYIANIVLFPLDHAVSTYIKQVNSSCKNGMIHACYARYVDDMIIFTDDYEVLCDIERLIVDELHRLKLAPSPKTDHASSISREDASFWLLDEKGGFGVSDPNIAPEDVFENCFYGSPVDVTNRRDALKMLRAGNDILESERSEKIEDLFHSCMRVEDIRYNDVVRLSAFVLEYLLENGRDMQGNTLFDHYMEFWEEMMEAEPKGELFFRKDVPILAFFDSSLKLARRRVLFSLPAALLEEHIRWQERFADEINKAIENAVNAYLQCGNTRNGYVIRLKAAELTYFVYELQKKNVPEERVISRLLNAGCQTVYQERWKLAFLPCEVTFPVFKNEDENENEGSIDIQVFHVVAQKLLAVDSKYEFDNLRSEFKAKYNDAPALGVPLIAWQILHFWFPENDQSQNGCLSEQALPAARTFFNITPKNILAEASAENKILCAALFRGTDGNINVLPVPPAVSYPGIVAEKENHTAFFRLDFSENVGTANELVWISRQELVSVGDIGGQYKQFTIESPDKLLPVSEYILGVDKDNGDWKIDIVSRARYIYQELQQLIKKYPNAILSKFHLFVDSNHKLYAFTYLDEERKFKGAALAEGSSSLQWHPVNDTENASAHIIGMLLWDMFPFRTPSATAQNSPVYKFLEYSVARLSGMNLEKYAISEVSFKKRVSNTLDSMKEFAQLANSRQQQEAFLLNCEIENLWMTTRYGREKYELLPGEELLLLCDWSDHVLKRYHEHFQTLENYRRVPDFPNMRRVPAAWLGFSDALKSFPDWESRTNNFWRILRLASLYQAVILTIRMQVLEYVSTLSDDEFLELQNRGLPLELLHRDDMVLYTSGRSVERQRELLFSDLSNYRTGRVSPQGGKTTPTGWYLLLAWLLECGTGTEVCTRLRQNVLRENKIAEWNDWLERFSQIQKSWYMHNSNDEWDFPLQSFEGVLLDEKERILQQQLDILRELDELWFHFEVQRKYSHIFQIQNGSGRTRQVTILRGGEKDLIRSREFNTFLSYESTMICEETRGSLTWTQTTYKGNVVGVSAISDGVSKMIFVRDGELEKQISPPDTLSNLERPTDSNPPDVRSLAESNFDQIMLEESPETAQTHLESKSIVHAEPSDTDANDMDTPSITDENDGFCGEILHDLNELQKMQKDNWKKREKEADIDRIAFFQFDVDDSYTHPLAEVCCREADGRTDGEIACFKKEPHTFTKGRAMRSCAELRRQQLLASAIEACNCFSVDILLLPEYSIRGETVAWIREELKKSSSRLSVWAGTYRIFPWQTFEGKEVVPEQSTKVYSAVLPVVLSKPSPPNDKYIETMEDGKEFPLIIQQRYKKYPAISLNEVINPRAQSCIEPLIKSLSDKTLEGRLWGDARDDVMELICAETFLATSPANLTSMARASRALAQRFGDQAKSYAEIIKNTTEDVLRISSHLGLRQMSFKSPDAGKPQIEHGRYGRTPIILVPAYTSRAVDYYIAGQASYLAAGVTTVFCNAVGMNTHGGSCFIGTDSWETRNLTNCAYMPDYSLYYGVFPGIYRQSDPSKTHGALGSREQALVICDIDPLTALRGKPTPETMEEPLKLIAHLPVIESKFYDKPDYKICRCARVKNDDESKKIYDEIKKQLHSIYSYTSDGLGTNTTIFQFGEALEKLGEICQSPGLKARGAQFKKYHNRNYQDTKELPILLDWLWIDVNFDVNDANFPSLEVPPFSDDQECKALDK